MPDNNQNSKKDIFSQGQLEGLKLRNRIIRAGCFEGMCQNGEVTEQLIEHHRRVAEGGVAMTTVAYCSVTFDGRAFEHEMWMRPELVPDLKKLTDAVHNEGAAVSIQLGHCGYFANKKVIKRRPLGASRKYNLFQQSFCKAMSISEIEEKIADFAEAAKLAKQAGFDAVEIHAG
ncbi:MAG: NADH:flavin oxidoreductase, partial [Bacteroidetes bacterium]